MCTFIYTRMYHRGNNNLFSGTHEAGLMLSHCSEELKRIYSLVQTKCTKINFFGDESAEFHTCAFASILMYRVCVFGVPFLSQNHRSVVAFSVRPLEDMNEITSHMLDVVQAHMVLRNSNTVRSDIIAHSAEHLRVCGFHSLFYLMYSQKE